MESLIKFELTDCLGNDGVLQGEGAPVGGTVLFHYFILIYTMLLVDRALAVVSMKLHGSLEWSGSLGS